MSTRDEIRDAIERYAYARCSEEDGYTISPSIEPVMALIEPHLRIAEAAMDREAVAMGLAYCQIMQEDGRRGADGRYFLVRWEEVETDD